jgi:Na+/melibiose symporter-like transporter
VASPGRVVGTDERTLFFAAAAGVFNIGWAASQNSHQALVPELTPLETERVVLNSVRYAAFVASNILVLASMFALLTANAFGPTPQTEDSPLTYSTLTGIVLGTGVCCAALFLALVRAPPPAPAAPQAAAAAAPAAAAAAAAPGRTPLQWLRTAAYYKTAALYVTMRLGTNITTLYMALFLTTTLGMEQGAIAAIPFVVFACSLGAVSQLKAATAALGVRRTLCAGAGVFAAGSAAILLLPPALAPVMYGAAACLGVGLAAITVSVATLQSSLLGSDTRSAGFVFGSHSALDKLVVGVVVLGVQIASDAPGVQLGEFFRYTLGLAPLAAVGLCAALALSLGGGGEEGGAGAGAGAAGSGAPVVATPNPLAAAADAQGALGEGQGKAGAAV